MQYPSKCEAIYSTLLFLHTYALIETSIETHFIELLIILGFEFSNSLVSFLEMPLMIANCFHPSIQKCVKFSGRGGNTGEWYETQCDQPAQFVCEAPKCKYSTISTVLQL